MVQINIDLTGVRKKLNDESMRRGRYAVANQALADMNQFVPKKESVLRNSATIDIDGTAVYYNTPYAKRRFYEPAYNYTTPGTGPRWDMKAKRIYMKDWERAYVKGAGW